MSSPSRLRIGVLMGGRSIEREVSFNSGRTVCDHLDKNKYTIIPVFQTRTGKLYVLPARFLHRGKISDFEHRLESEAQAVVWDDLKNLVDFVYIAMHGRYAEDGILQGTLEVLGIPYLGTKVYGSALCMDKITQKKMLQIYGIAVPKDVIVSAQKVIGGVSCIPLLVHELTSKGIGFPCVVKPQQEGSSIGISVVEKEEDLYTALVNACHAHPTITQDVLIEEKITGMEFTCIIITDYIHNKPLVLPPTEIVLEEHATFYDYAQKYMPGKAHKYTPARCSAEQQKAIQNTCLQVMEALEMKNIARIDGFLTSDGRVIIIDPNTITGMSPASFLFCQAAEIGMNHTRLINHLIETELYAYNM